MTERAGKKPPAGLRIGRNRCCRKRVVMITRSAFVALTASAVAVPPKPSPSPAPAPMVAPWDRCVDNPILPYDRPLGLRMRVLDGPDFDLVKYRGYAVILNI